MSLHLELEKLARKNSGYIQCWVKAPAVVLNDGTRRTKWSIASSTVMGAGVSTLRRFSIAYETNLEPKTCLFTQAIDTGLKQHEQND